MGAGLFSLKGRVALVTGSTSGIGLALARGLAGAGAMIVLNSHVADELNRTRELLSAEGLEVRDALFDVTDSAAVIRQIAHIESDVGPIDVLVNNAGIQRPTPLENFSEQDWDDLIRVNMDGVFYVARAVAKHMIPRRRGAIINICSINSELARPAIAPYTATKGAVKMLTKGMAVDWGRYGIRVNGIGPGYFETPLTRHLVADEAFTGWVKGRVPLGRWGQVEDLVGAAVFLASDAASFVTGHVLYVDGGVTAAL
ncbi:MAG: SDR family oxidoreductase [Hyphomicrobiaceae bacterium]